MLLVRYGPPGAETPGVVLGSHVYSTAAVTADYNEAFFARDGLARLAAYVARLTQLGEPLPAGTRLGCPVARPSKIVGIGLNYADHARATGEALPTEPALFLKATTALAGPTDPILLPPGSKQTDWEVELGIVVGSTARFVPEAEALRYVAGYVLLNDVSERSYQFARGGDADKGKGCDSFAPVGPYLATPDEIADVHDLPLWLRVNGQLMQQGSTRHLLFKVPYLVAYISRFMTLLPGDIIATGTPAGTGYRQQPPVFLRAGDELTYGIGGLGTARQRCIPAPYQAAGTT